MRICNPHYFCCSQHKERYIDCITANVCLQWLNRLFQAGKTRNRTPWSSSANASCCNFGLAFFVKCEFLFFALMFQNPVVKRMNLMKQPLEKLFLRALQMQSLCHSGITFCFRRLINAGEISVSLLLIRIVYYMLYMRYSMNLL